MPRFFASQRRWLFCLLMLLGFAQVGLAVFAARFLDRIYVGNSQSDSVKSTLAASPFVDIFGLLLAIGLAEFLRRWLTESLGLDFARDVRLALFERLIRKPYIGGKVRSRGNVLLPFVGDLTALRSWCADGIARGCSSAMVAIGLCTYFLWTQARLGLVMSVVFLATLVLLGLITRPYAKATRKQRRARGSLTGFVSDRIEAAHSVFAQGGLRREISVLRQKNTRMNSASLQRARWSGLIRAITATAPLIASFLAVFLSAVSAGTDSNHSVVGSLLLASLLGVCISDLGRTVELAIPGLIAARRLKNRISEIAPLPTTSKNKPKKSEPVSALMEVRNLMLNGWTHAFSATCKVGDIILIDAHSEVQKSLFMANLMGLQPLKRGSVEILGHDAQSIPQKFRRENLGLASPNLPLLQGSLAANVLFRQREPISDTEIEALMRMVGLAHYLSQDGTIIRKSIRDDGAYLADSEVAAIKLARALAGNPKILLLDGVLDDLEEATTNRLIPILAAWQGIVLISSENRNLRKIANRHWHLSDYGAHEAHNALGSTTANVIPMPNQQASNS